MRICALPRHGAAPLGAASPGGRGPASPDQCIHLVANQCIYLVSNQCIHLVLNQCFHVVSNQCISLVSDQCIHLVSIVMCLMYVMMYCVYIPPWVYLVPSGSSLALGAVWGGLAWGASSPLGRRMEWPQLVWTCVCQYVCNDVL